MSKSDTVARARQVWFPAFLFPNNLPFRPTLSHPFPPQALQAPTRVLSGETLTSGGHV